MLEIYIDGASAGNPGPSGIGIFIKGEGHLIKISEYIGESDNNRAEFHACIRALEEALKLESQLISLRSDSKIVVSSIEKRYVKNEQFKPLLEQILHLADQFNLFFVKWIPDTENRAADALAREAVLKKTK